MTDPVRTESATTTYYRRGGIAFWWTMFVGALLVVLGLLIGAGGVWLIALGGS
jgi:quinoprotein glucose dehydrogenase